MVRSVVSSALTCPDCAAFCSFPSEVSSRTDRNLERSLSRSSGGTNRIRWRTIFALASRICSNPPTNSRSFNLPAANLLTTKSFASRLPINDVGHSRSIFWIKITLLRDQHFSRSAAAVCMHRLRTDQKEFRRLPEYASAALQDKSEIAPIPNATPQIHITAMTGLNPPRTSRCDKWLLSPT